MSQNKKVIFIDAYAIIYRAYYAFFRNPMYNASGLNTSVLYGFLSALEEVRNKEKPSHLAVAFDTSAPTFRHKMYVPYKANREETPEDIRQSVPLLKELLDAYRIPILECDGYEADDIIGTLSKQAADKGFKVYMLTPDKDFSQLVDENIFLYKPSRSGKGADVLGVAEICKMYGIDSPVQFVDILALMGDASDNIPGAKGIGEKGAAKLIAEYNSVENLIEHIHEVKGAIKEKIENSIDNILLSKKLAKISLDVPVVFDETCCLVEDPDVPRLKELLLRYNFRTFLNRLDSLPESAPVRSSSSVTLLPPRSYSGSALLFSDDEMSAVIPHQTSFDFGSSVPEESDSTFGSARTTPHQYTVVSSPEQRASLVNLLSGSSRFSFDTETTGLDTSKAALVGLSFSVKESQAWYVPVSGDFGGAVALLSEFRSVFENPDLLKVGQNVKFDILMLKKYGVEVQEPLFDTMLAHYLIQPEQRHNLNYLANKYLHYSPVPIEQLIGKKGKDQRNMKDVPIEEIAEYAAEDADIALRLYAPLAAELDNLGMRSLAEQIEMPLAAVLADIEEAGVRLDLPTMKEAGKDLTGELIQMEQEIFEMAGMEFNVSSPRQLGEVLFEKMKIGPSAKKTKTKQYATSEEVLMNYASKHPIVNKILEYRMLKKLLSTYIEALPRLVDSRTGKIHTSYNQAVTATGRLSSTDPNLQNIPIRDARGREIRKAFVSSGDHYYLLSADYSQIELRLMAHVSADVNMIQAFNDAKDIHAATAARIYGIPQNEVTREMRSKAKTANFGIIYGISVFGLSQRLQISRSEAQDLIAGYFKAYPDVRRYMNDIILKAKEQGYVETILGRRRYLPEIHSSNAVVRGMAERNAINAPIQGSAADLIKLTMVRIRNEFRAARLKTKLILQVHDELVFDVYLPEREQIREIVRRNMEQVVSLRVPLIVDMGEGSNWFEAH